MAGKPNTKHFATMVAKHGSPEAVREWYQEQGAKGGKNSRNGGFGSKKVGSDGLTGQERAGKAGSIGGKISKRGSKSE